MKRFLSLIFLLSTCYSYAQQSINNYKYILVPEKFSFLKEINQYGLNTLTKALLEEKGFTVFFDNNQLPAEIANNKCKALTFDLLQRKSMFTTNLTLSLKDCQGNVVFKGNEGKSREKEFETSYNLALRDAFTTLNELSYAYTATAPGAAAVPQATIPVTAQVSNTVASTVPVNAAVPVNVPAQTNAPVAEAGTLYAQANANGYQLIDTTPKIVLTLLKTSAVDYFIASSSTAQGIVFKKNDNWIFEYYVGGKLTTEKLSIKF